MLAIVVILGVMVMSSYNSFVTLEENVDQSYAGLKISFKEDWI